MASLHCYTYHLVDYVSARPGLLRELVELLAQDPSAILLNSFCPLTSDLWFVAVAWERNKDEIVAFLQSQAVRDHLQDESKSVDSPFFSGKCLLSAYLTAHNFTELHLDHIFKLTDTDPELPSGFWTSIPNVRSLSLRSNYLRLLPGDVGRLKHLERLSLTNNRLGNRSLPYTLIFCQKLNELYLDNNLLDAMPDFLLKMPALRTVHRHGNHNYFKATFMWYHTDVNERILPEPGEEEEEDDDLSPSEGRKDGGETSQRKVKKQNCTGIRMAKGSLQYLAAYSIVSSRQDFFLSPSLPPRMKSFLSQLSIQLNLCDACPKVAPRTSAGYKVFTFKNPYLGNTCVPFLHWACSLECANEVEIPARAEQILSAQAQDRAYEQYVIKAVNQLRPCQRSLTSVSLSSLEDSNTHASAGEDGGSLKCQSEAGNSNSNSNCVIL